MTGRELLRLVWINIIQNKTKAIMTSIGIIVGAATIVMVIAIGKGGKLEVAEQFKNLNAGAIDITYELSEDARESMNGFGGMGGMMGGFGNRGGGFSEDNGSSDSGNGNMPGMPQGGGFSGGDSSSEGGSEGMPQGGGFPGDDSSSGNENGNTPSMPEGMEMPERMEMPEGMERPDGEGFGGKDGNTEEDDSERINQEPITLSDTDVEEIETFVAGLEAATISCSSKADVEGGELEEATTYTIAGVREEYESMSNLSLTVGTFITESENENKEKVCVLGATVAEQIFGSAIDAYGSVIYIDGRSYVVNGVLEQMGTVALGISPDEAIFIPYETDVKYITGTDVDPTITVIAEDVEQIDAVIEQIAEVLAQTYLNAEFTYTDAGSKMEAANASNEIMTLVLSGMAAIVFLVGGIGIMNVLFVSVKERTSEIGILKAIGCSKKDILLEFLMEAAFISIIGGVIGVLISIGITPLVERFDIRVELSGQAFIIAVGFALLTGTIFGFYPAWKASRLVPVEALNAE